MTTIVSNFYNYIINLEMKQIIIVGGCVIVSGVIIYYRGEIIDYFTNKTIYDVQPIILDFHPSNTCPVIPNFNILPENASIIDYASKYSNHFLIENNNLREMQTKICEICINFTMLSIEQKKEHCAGVINAILEDNTTNLCYQLYLNLHVFKNFVTKYSYTIFSNYVNVIDNNLELLTDPDTANTAILTFIEYNFPTYVFI